MPIRSHIPPENASNLVVDPEGLCTFSVPEFRQLVNACDADGLRAIDAMRNGNWWVVSTSDNGGDYYLARRLPNGRLEVATHWDILAARS